MVNDVIKERKQRFSVLDHLDELPLFELRNIVRQLKETQIERKKRQRAKRLWQKNRKMLIKAYASDDIIQGLSFYLNNQEKLPKLFNMDEISKHWEAFEKNIGRKIQIRKPLPTSLNSSDSRYYSRVVFIGLMQPLVENLLANASLPTSRTAIYVAAHQIDQSISGKLPGTGNVLDCEHGLALHFVDIIYTRDLGFATILRKASKNLNLEHVKICCTKNELQRALRF